MHLPAPKTPQPRTGVGVLCPRPGLQLPLPVDLAAALAPFGKAGPSSDSVSLALARAKHEAGHAVRIDGREPEEHATAAAAAGTRLPPMRRFGQRWQERPGDCQQAVLLSCNTQNRSSGTLPALRDQGHGHVRCLNRGAIGWARRGRPVVRPAADRGA